MGIEGSKKRSDNALPSDDSEIVDEAYCLPTMNPSHSKDEESVRCFACDDAVPVAG